jgi:CRISPR-associated protein Cas1
MSSWLVTDRILEISNTAARLRLDLDRVRIETEAHPAGMVPIRELAAVVLAHPQITVSQPLLSALGGAGVPLIACDSRGLPCAMMLPIVGHSTQAERMEAQARAPAPLRKRLWKQVVQEKVKAQARALIAAHGTDAGLARLAARVRSGDSTHIEAQASARYWRKLFGRTDFRRNREAPDENRLLNYGYAVLRALVARSVCASGLHPSLGIHHHNRYDPFVLADDLMEPYRPVIDRIVVEIVSANGADVPLTTEVKLRLLGVLVGRHSIDGEWRTLTDLVRRAAASLASVYAGSRTTLELGVP